MRRALAAAVLAALVACSPEAPEERRTAVEHGRDLFASPRASESASNVFSCATCHRAVPAPADARILPGADLAGALQRPTYWGGAHTDVLRAMNDCRFYFMGAQRSWSETDEPARGMYAFLESLPPVSASAQPFTVVPTALDLPAGDPARGSVVYTEACASCHGAARSGEGKLRESIPTLPEQSVAYFATLGFDRTQTRITFVEKVRHGPFLGLYGSMPPFSKESLRDEELGALLAFLALY